MKTSRLSGIEDNMGAKLTTNGDTCDVLKSSPEIFSFEKNVSQEYALGMLANPVTSRGCGTVTCFGGR